MPWVSGGVVPCCSSRGNEILVVQSHEVLAPMLSGTAAQFPLRTCEQPRRLGQQEWPIPIRITGGGAAAEDKSG